MLQSSTPQGIAPLTPLGVLFFVLTACSIYLLYGILSLLMLLRVGDEPQKLQQINELTHKIFVGVLGFFKFGALVTLAATLIFFFTIMGAVEHFDSFYLSLAYLFGVLNSLVCALASVLASKLIYSRILASATFSLQGAYAVAKKAANFQTFLTTGWTLLIMSLYVILYQVSNEEQQKDQQVLAMTAKTMISFSFGCSTVCIATKICHSIYSKSSQMSVQTLSLYENRLRRNSRHPALICKAVGEFLNKSVSSALENTMYLSASISLGLYAAATNIIGTDQNGEIVFELNFCNIYLPILSPVFSMLFLWIFNALINQFIYPHGEDGVRKMFNLQRYLTVLMLSGFQALAAYLALPAEFMVEELGSLVRHPYHAYLCILLGMLITFLIVSAAQIITTHPFFVNIISGSCKTGSATNIIYGLSLGYLFNFIPIILVTVTGFLGNLWLGTYGVTLVVTGIVSLLPLYTNFSLIYSAMDNSSYLSYILELEESVIDTLVTASKTRKDFEPHLQVYFYVAACLLGYATLLEFISLAGMHDSDSLNSPYIFAGLLTGALFPYVFSANLLQSVYRTCPVIAYDLRMQIEEIPSMSQGNIDPDFIRTNSLFGFQCALSVKYFLPVLFLPFVVLGIALGPQIVLGFLIGSTISGVQLGLSNGISGSIWSVVKKEINFGSLKDEQMDVIRNDSQWGRAAEVGSQVGQPLKDCVNSGIHSLLTFSFLAHCVMASVYSSIHS